MTPPAMLATEPDTTVSLLGGGQITFDSYCAEQLQALILDILIG